VVKLPKSGGVVTRSPAARKAARVQRVREYFYGPRGDLLPHVVELTFAEASVFKVGGGPRADASALPIGEVTDTPSPVRAKTLKLTFALTSTSGPVLISPLHPQSVDLKVNRPAAANRAGG
jgi:polyribonucleotide 5'-hydroxyl-kinase